MGRLFGTDGIRGAANSYPLTVEMFINIGRALAHLYRQPGQHVPQIIIGKDTRLSGDMLESALAAGICSAGGNALMADVLPTPGVAYLTASLPTDAGVVISASHNPFEDNGIKIFGPGGWKLADENELDIESWLLDQDASSLSVAPDQCGRISRLADADSRYMDFVKRSFKPTANLDGVSIVLDCSHGAASHIAPETFLQLGVRISTLFNTPNGVNINLHCGSQHPEALARAVVKQRAAAGFAFDGDADRLIAVDEKGTVLTGDQILTICAAALKKAGRLTNNLVVRTVMSNCGMGVALQSLGIDSVMTDVGDRAVLLAMQKRGAVIGGEDSGHLIFLEHHNSGDGMITALQVLAVMLQEGRPLSELAQVMTVFPQTLINVAVTRKDDPDTIPELVKIIKDVENKLGTAGRVLVRYSGTQNLCRVMVEGPKADLTERYCRQIAAVAQEKLA